MVAPWDPPPVIDPIFNASDQQGPDWVIILISIGIGVGTLMCTWCIYLWTAGWRRRRKAGQMQVGQKQRQGLGNSRASVMREEFKFVSEDGRLHKVSVRPGTAKHDALAKITKAMSHHPGPLLDTWSGAEWPPLHQPGTTEGYSAIAAPVGTLVAPADAPVGTLVAPIRAAVPKLDMEQLTRGASKSAAKPSFPSPALAQELKISPRTAKLGALSVSRHSSTRAGGETPQKVCPFSRSFLRHLAYARNPPFPCLNLVSPGLFVFPYSALHHLVISRLKGVESRPLWGGWFKSFWDV
jgi:hypothetical protein